MIAATTTTVRTTNRMTNGSHFDRIEPRILFNKFAIGLFSFPIHNETIQRYRLLAGSDRGARELAGGSGHCVIR